MAVEIRESTVDEMRASAGPLLAAHWEEVEGHRDALPLNVDWVHYEFMERLGLMVLFVATDGAAIIGYVLAAIVKHPHHLGSTICRAEAIYVDPSYRGHGIGPRLLHKMQEQAARHGAKVVTLHAKPGTTMEALAARSGYRVLETSYSREL